MTRTSLKSINNVEKGGLDMVGCFICHYGKGI